MFSKYFLALFIFLYSISFGYAQTTVESDTYGVRITFPTDWAVTEGEEDIAEKIEELDESFTKENLSEFSGGLLGTAVFDGGEEEENLDNWIEDTKSIVANAIPLALAVRFQNTSNSPIMILKVKSITDKDPAKRQVNVWKFGLEFSKGEFIDPPAEVLVNSMPALRVSVRYSNEQKTEEIKEVEYMFLHDAFQFNLVFASDEDEFNTYMQDFSSVLNSLEFF